MPDTKTYSPGLVTYWWVGAGGITNINRPTATEINAGVNLSLAVADDATNVGVTESSDIDDRAITDAGNAVEVGPASFEAALNLFRPANMTDLNDPYVKAYNLFKTQRVTGYIVKRIGVPYTQTAAAGEMVSVFKVISAYTSNDTAGEDSVKFLVQFLPQGQLSVNTLVSTVTVPTLDPTTASIAPGAKTRIKATLHSYDETTGGVWSSSDPAVATVTNAGVVTAIATGSATVTFTHPSSTGTPPTATITVT